MRPTTFLATLATKGEAAGLDVLVVSGDRDTFQLVTEKVTVLYPECARCIRTQALHTSGGRGAIRNSSRSVSRHRSARGRNIGQSPGVDKVGEKTAVKWIQQYGSLDEVLAHRDEIGGVVGNNLRDQIANVERNARLNKLVRDLELPVALDDLARRPD